MIKTKSVYDTKEPSDGLRILIMRKWPRGISKEKVDLRLKGLAPSHELLNEVNGAKKQGKLEEFWPEFEKRHLNELKGKPKEVDELRRIIDNEPVVTLLCWERGTSEDQVLCHRRLLKEYLEGRKIRRFYFLDIEDNS